MLHGVKPRWCWFSCTISVCVHTAGQFGAPEHLWLHDNAVEGSFNWLYVAVVFCACVTPAWNSLQNSSVFKSFYQLNMRHFKIASLVTWKYLKYSENSIRTCEQENAKGFLDRLLVTSWNVFPGNWGLNTAYLEKAGEFLIPHSSFLIPQFFFLKTTDGWGTRMLWPGWAVGSWLSSSSVSGGFSALSSTCSI